MKLNKTILSAKKQKIKELEHRVRRFLLQLVNSKDKISFSINEQ